MLFVFYATAKAPRADRHKLAGVITVGGIPKKRIVIVFDRSNLTPIASTYSNQETGEWKITGIPEYPERQLLVLSLDHTGKYNAEVADYVSQVASA